MTVIPAVPRAGYPPLLGIDCIADVAQRTLPVHEFHAYVARRSEKYEDELEGVRQGNEEMHTVVVQNPDPQRGGRAGDEWQYTSYGYMTEHAPMNVTVNGGQYQPHLTQDISENIAAYSMSPVFRATFDVHAHLHWKVYCRGDAATPGWNGTTIAVAGTVTVHTQQMFGSHLIPDTMLGQKHIVLIPIMETSEAEGIELIRRPDYFILPPRPANMTGCRTGFFTG